MFPGRYDSHNVTVRENNLSCYILQVSLIACTNAFISSGLRRTLSAPQSKKCSISDGSPELKLKSKSKRRARTQSSL
jgi:hypothetical protein